MTDTNIICFMFGMLAGAFTGTIVMCMMQISKQSDDDLSIFYKEEDKEDKEHDREDR